MAERGVLVTALTQGAKIAEKGLAVPLGVAGTIREGFFRASFAGVERIEGINRSALKAARDALERADKLSQDAISGLESAVGSISKALGKPCQAAAEDVSEQATPPVEAEVPPRPRVASPV